MTYLITGGAGFLGTALTRLLAGEGHRPVLFDLAPPETIPEDVRQASEYVQGSVANLPELLAAMKGCSVETIFHLGGMLSVPCDDRPQAAFQANVVGTYHVLEAARLERVKQVIFGSSIAVYSRDLPSENVDDFTLERPNTMYGATKVFGELVGVYYGRRYDLDFRGARLPSVVGPGSRTAHMSIYNSWAIEEPLKGNPYVIQVDPDTRCPAIYYKDAVRALRLLSQAPRDRIKTGIYNIAGIVPPYSAGELADAVRERIPGAQLDFQPDARISAFLSSLGRLRLDDSRARHEWGWRVEYGLAEMIEDFMREFGRG
ncbi:MAG: NAD-dependent epimerase/dehydratase family protein [Deltaproteobacteria bacterium]|nr:NAD-dependent epimerase/dehydratase family protein [Deltaproteobacteria bacterium]